MTFTDFCGFIEICCLPLLGLGLLGIRREVRELKKLVNAPKNPNIRVIQREVKPS